MTNYEKLLKARAGVAMTEKIEIVIPSTYDVDKPIDNAKAVEECGRLLAELFGGYSALPLKGGWIADGGNLVEEFPTAVYAYTTIEGLNKGIRKVLTYVAKIKKELRQEAIMITVSGKAYFL